MKVVRVSLTDFELEDGSIHPIIPPLDKEISVEEFQEIYDETAHYITSIKDAERDPEDNHPSNDDEFIKLALREYVSGAVGATAKKRKMKRSRGASRGKGLKKIAQTCKKFKIEFSILSHFGYLFVDSEGEISYIGSRSRRVFGGTLYHFNIPTK